MLAAGWQAPVFAQSQVVRFGQSASLSGGQAEYGKDVRDGIVAAFNAANKADSKGPKFELVTLDDGGDKERCKANVKKLIDSGVTALLGLTSGAAAEVCMPIVEEQKIVMLGTASGNMGIRSDKSSMAFHVRSGYDEEYRRMVTYVKAFNMQRVGYVFLKDTLARQPGRDDHGAERRRPQARRLGAAGLQPEELRCRSEDPARQQARLRAVHDQCPADLGDRRRHGRGPVPSASTSRPRLPASP